MLSTNVVVDQSQLEQTPTPLGGTAGTESNNVRKQKSVCRYYKNGTCKYGGKGTGCPFDHPKKCWKFMAHGEKNSRGCRKGSKCDLYHPPMCRSSLSSGVCSKNECKLNHVRGTKITPKNAEDIDHRSERSPQARNVNQILQPNSGGTYADAARARPVTPTQDTDSGSYQQNFRELRCEIQEMRNLVMRLLERDRWLGGSQTTNYRGYRDPHH